MTLPLSSYLVMSSPTVAKTQKGVRNEDRGWPFQSISLPLRPKSLQPNDKIAAKVKAMDRKNMWLKISSPPFLPIIRSLRPPSFSQTVFLVWDGGLSKSEAAAT